MTAAETLKIRDLPSPKGDLFIGHLRQFRSADTHLVLERWIKECGDLFKINLMGKQFLICADESINKQILSLRPNKFRRLSIVSNVMREIGVDGVFNAEADWKRHRRPISAAMSVSKIKDYFPLIQDKASGTLQNLKRYAQTGETRDIKKDFMSFAIDTVTFIAFGYELDMIHCEEHDFQQHLETIFATTNDRLTAPFPIWRYFKREKDKAFDRAMKAVSDTIYQFIEQAKAALEHDPQRRENPSNLLETLLADTQDIKFSDHEVFGNVFTMLLAGEETTSNTLSLTTLCLLQQPEVIKKIRAEALAVYGKHEVPQNREQLLALHYTNGVVQEAMRLKPTLPQQYFQANQDIQLDNLSIPKDTQIIVQSGAAQKRERYFSNADDFAPERWVKATQSNYENHTPSAQKPFGGGPRFCPGKMLATEEMTLLVSALYKQFEVELAVDPKQIEEEFVFTMSPMNLLVKLKPAS